MLMNERLVRPFRSHAIAFSAVFALALGISACSSEAPSAEPEAAAEPAAEAMPEASGPHVSFVQPQDGATEISPVHFEFGLEGFELAAVPPGEIEMARPDMGHHHLGVDTDCLPAGEIIPKADPWVHFGDGNTGIDMQLAPGSHTFALQIGDDEHRTIEGLCSTISITVAEQ